MTSLPPEHGISPDVWVMLEICKDGQSVKRILSGWRGGYLDSDVWRLSTAVVEAHLKHDHSVFVTSSGSFYRCWHRAEGLTGVISEIYNRLSIQAEATGSQVKVLNGLV